MRRSGAVDENRIGSRHRHVLVLGERQQAAPPIFCAFSSSRMRGSPNSRTTAQDPSRDASSTTTISKFIKEVVHYVTDFIIQDIGQTKCRPRFLQIRQHGIQEAGTDLHHQSGSTRGEGLGQMLEMLVRCDLAQIDQPPLGDEISHRISGIIASFGRAMNQRHLHLAGQQSAQDDQRQRALHQERQQHDDARGGWRGGIQ